MIIFSIVFNFGLDRLGKDTTRCESLERINCWAISFFPQRGKETYAPRH